MIQNLTIKNFQSHKKTFLEFHKGLNVIVGPTDSGKSAIIRALRWVVWNKPSGDAFRSTWGGNTHVSIETDSYSIARNKGDHNNYVLRSTGEEEVIKFNAIGANVPDEIVQVLNMDEVNLQQQLDTPFLLSESPGKVAAFLNKVAGIDLIDKSIKDIQKEIKDTERSIKIKRAQLKTKKQEVLAYDELEKIEMDIERLEELEKRRNTLSRHKKELTRRIISIQTILVKIKQESAILELKPIVDLYIGKIEDKKKLEERYISLARKIKTIKSVNSKIQIYAGYVKLEEPVKILITKVNSKAVLTTKYSRLNTLLTNYNKVKENVLTSQENVDKLTIKYTTNLPDTCPLCGTKLTCKKL